MIRLIAIFLLAAQSALGAVNALNGVAVTTSSNINGVTTPSAVNGQSIASAGALTLTYLTSATDGADQTSYTFTSQSIGNPGDRDYVLIVVYGRSTATDTMTVSSVSVGGNSATLCPGAISQFGDFPNSMVVGIYYATVASGTTANVDVTFSAACVAAAVSVYTIKGNASTTPFDTTTASGTGGSSANLNCDTPSGNSVILAAAYVAVGSDLTFSWSGVSKDADLFWDTSRNASAAHAAFSGAATRTVTPSWVSSGSHCDVSASFQ